MNRLLEKLNYKGNNRIAVLNAEINFVENIFQELREVTIDKEIDPRFPYEFIMIFVRTQAEIENLALVALHNLLCDGLLWFCYPKKTSKKYTSTIDRDHGWKTLNNVGFYGIRLVAIDDDWSAMRFRSVKFIKSSSAKFAK